MALRTVIGSESYFRCEFVAEYPRPVHHSDGTYRCEVVPHPLQRDSTVRKSVTSKSSTNLATVSTAPWFRRPWGFPWFECCRADLVIPRGRPRRTAEG